MRRSPIWINRVLNIFYMYMPLKDELIKNEIMAKFELTDDDMTLMTELKK